jgi:4-hydroxybenzoate polyprenyltransferase
MDVEPDRVTGKRTLAVTIGPRAAKLVISLFLVVEAALALKITSKPWLPCFLAASAGWFGLDNVVIWRARAYTPWQMRLFFVGWNLLLFGEVALSCAVAKGYIHF